MKITSTTLGLTILLVSGALAAAPPAPKAPDIELRVEGEVLKYTYDLTSLFDAKLWRILENHVTNEILVEVKLRDAKGRTVVTQYHRLGLTLLKSGRIQLATGPGQRRTFKNRRAMLRALTRIPGKPIAESTFAGPAGHLEIQALVNPVKVYSFPADNAPVAQQRVVPQTFFDGKLNLKSGTLRKP